MLQRARVSNEETRQGSNIIRDSQLTMSNEGISEMKKPMAYRKMIKILEQNMAIDAQDIDLKKS